MDFADLHVEGELPFNLVCVNAPELPALHAQLGAAVLRGSLHDRRLGLGGRRRPAELGPRVRPRRRDLGLLALRAGDHLQRLAGAGRARSRCRSWRRRRAATSPACTCPTASRSCFSSTSTRRSRARTRSASSRRSRARSRRARARSSCSRATTATSSPSASRACARRPATGPTSTSSTSSSSAAEMAALMRRADCYVSLHRAEGFGLTLGETMALGKPVIATGFSANLDFMTAENSYLVRHTETLVGPRGRELPRARHVGRAGPRPRRAAHARGVGGPGRGRARAAPAPSARSPSTSRWRPSGRSRASASSAWRPGTGASTPASRPAAAPRAATTTAAASSTRWVETAELKLTYDPLRDARATGGAKGAARRAALAAMRPYTHHQDELSRFTVHGLREIDNRLDDLTLDTQAQIARLQVARASLRGGDLQGADAARRGHARAARVDAPGDLADRRARPPRAALRRRLRATRPPTAASRTSSAATSAPCCSSSSPTCRTSPAPSGCSTSAAAAASSSTPSSPATSARAAPTWTSRWSRAASRRATTSRSPTPRRTCAASTTARCPGMFAAQVVEHLDADQLTELLGLMARKLAPGGAAVMETVNPHNPAALKAFWTDTTHHHPLFPEVLLALCRLAGFESGEVRFPQESGELRRRRVRQPRLRGDRAQRAVSARPELTICCAVNTPPGRVAAALAPLAGLGAEIVLAVDDRVDGGWIDGYRQIADRILLVPFPGNFGRMYAWVREQCAGRWILQLDHDEVPAPGLAGEVGDDDRRRRRHPRVAAAPLAVPRRVRLARAMAVAPGLRAAPRAQRPGAAALPGPAALHRARDSGRAATCTRRCTTPISCCRTAPSRERKQAAYEREMPGFVIDGVSLNRVYYLPEERAGPAAGAGAGRGRGGRRGVSRRRRDRAGALAARRPGRLGSATAAEIACLSEAARAGRGGLRRAARAARRRPAPRQRRMAHVRRRGPQLRQRPLAGRDAGAAADPPRLPLARGRRRAARGGRPHRPAGAAGARRPRDRPAARCSARRGWARARSRSTSCTRTCAGSAGPSGRRRGPPAGRARAGDPHLRGVAGPGRAAGPTSRRAR